MKKYIRTSIPKIEPWLKTIYHNSYNDMVEEYKEWNLLFYRVGYINNFIQFIFEKDMVVEDVRILESKNLDCFDYKITTNSLIDYFYNLPLVMNYKECHDLYPIIQLEEYMEGKFFPKTSKRPIFRLVGKNFNNRRENEFIFITSTESDSYLFNFIIEKDDIYNPILSEINEYFNIDLIDKCLE